jgi:hypothetical protein
MVTCIVVPEVCSGYYEPPNSIDIDLRVSWSNDGILLKWNLINSSLITPEHPLTIYRMCWMTQGTCSEPPFIYLNSTTTEYLDTNVQVGTFYEYALGFWNGDFFESFCGNKGFTYGGSLPARPSEVSVTLYDACICLNWRLLRWEIGGGEFESFEIYRSENGSPLVLYDQMKYEEISWNNLYEGIYNYYDRNVTFGVNYSYSIKTVSTIGEGKTSFSVEETPGYAPRNITISPRSAGVSEEINATISWNMPSDAEGIIGYRIFSYGEVIQQDKHNFNCSSIDFGYGPCRVASVYDDGRIVFGNEVGVSRPRMADVGGYQIQYLITFLIIVSILGIAIILIHKKQKNQK